MSIVRSVDNVRNTAPEFALEAIGERLRLAREHVGLSQQEFAEKIGFSRRQIIAWEKAENAPPVWVFARVRDVCDVSPEWVLSGPGLTPLQDVTAEDRSRERRVVRDIDKIARGYGLSLSRESLDDLARIVLRELPELEGEAIKRMTETLRALSLGGK